MLIYAWASTGTGRRRDENQDNYLLAPELKLFAVADGMGGHNGGEVASAMAIRAIDEHMRAHNPRIGGAPAIVLADSLRRANDEILARSQREPDLARMGTTTTSVVFSDDKAYFAHPRRRSDRAAAPTTSRSSWPTPWTSASSPPDAPRCRADISAAAAAIRRRHASNS